MRSVFVWLLAIFSLLPFAGLTQTAQVPLRNGDLLFIESTSGQGKAIRLATHSKYTHIGIVFIEEGKPVVYHAVEPVMKSSLEEFTAMSAGKTCQVKRLKNQGLLTEAVLADMKKAAVEALGRHYDLAFGWDDEQLYCSEYVWKLYKRTLNLEIGKPRPLKDFDLSHPVVKYMLKERYGKNIPLNEQMISPGDMYDSTLLE